CHMTRILPAEILVAIDRQRTERGFLSVVQLLDVAASKAAIILDPFSTLVSAAVELGTGSMLYANVVIEATNGGRIVVSSGNVFYAGALLLANGGAITIGDGNQFGPGGVTIRAS